jgi:hypothetical protein
MAVQTAKGTCGGHDWEILSIAVYTTLAKGVQDEYPLFARQKYPSTGTNVPVEG